jgi:Kdo2-lipid IVA lauroyltransferase/acyltransferase
MNTKELRRELRAWGARGLPGLLGVILGSWGRAVCAGIGRSAHRLVGRDRRLARANLARVHPEWTEATVKVEARRVFEEIGRNAYDFLRYPSLSPRDRASLVSWRGEEHLADLLSRGRGAVVVTGHLGSWELLAAAMVERGYPLCALARPLREPRLERLLASHRSRMGIRTFPAPGVPPAALRHLRRGGFLGVLMDHRVKRGGVEVSFLGLPTRMTEGPARLALSLGTPVVVVGIRRLADHRHLAEVLPPWTPNPGDDVPGVTQKLASQLESLIAAAPEQWMWIHPRWEAGTAGGDRPRETGGTVPEGERECVAL